MGVDADLYLGLGGADIPYFRGIYPDVRPDFFAEVLDDDLLQSRLSATELQVLL
jgi:hypothetical protein